ncbi:MAG: hypothetical protein HY927_04625 [Elusimicrobia bacterium]|nr:hypothetical protein [Elusimicrobiota bacterium]
MLTRPLILRLLRALNKELRAMGAVGEIGLCGGAVMCLVFKAREATKAVDAIFRPSAEIRRAAKAVAARFDLPDDWLNDAVKSYFHAEPPREPVLDLSNLRVWAPSPDYLLAMKCVAARFDTHDHEDVVFLLRYLRLSEPEAVFTLIERYYPRRAIPAKARFFVEEILAG